MDHCDVCGEALPPTGRGRPRRYCSRSCQGRAYRARQRSRPVVRPPRPQTLTPARLTAAAIALADAEGVEGLTMRRLSTALGVATTTLYRHFPSRDALVTAMADTVMGEIEAPDPAGTWRERLESAAWEEWKLYRRHPWVLPVLATTRPPLGPNILDAVERVLSAAADADRPPAAA
ncbi:TetR family transcriptional regulator, partial [Glycomyces tenuis]